MKLSEFIDFKTEKTGTNNSLTIIQQVRLICKNLARRIGAEVQTSLNQKGLNSRANLIEHIEATGGKDDVKTYNLIGSMNLDLLSKTDLIKEMQDVINYLNKIDNKFKIHYSNRMYMPAKFTKGDSGGKAGKFKTDKIGRDYQIASGTLNNYMKSLSKITGTSAEIEKLTFMLHNIGDGALYAGDSSKAAAALATISAAWMFDDISDMFLESALDLTKSGSSSIDLHVFVLNGAYIPVSSILFQLAEQLQRINQLHAESIVKVNINTFNSQAFYKTNIRRQTSIRNNDDWERWQYLRNVTEKNTSLSIKLNKALINNFLSSLNS